MFSTEARSRTGRRLPSSHRRSTRSVTCSRTRLGNCGELRTQGRVPGLKRIMILAHLLVELVLGFVASIVARVVVVPRDLRLMRGDFFLVAQKLRLVVDQLRFQPSERRQQRSVFDAPPTMVTQPAVVVGVVVYVVVYVVGLLRHEESLLEGFAPVR